VAPADRRWIHCSVVTSRKSPAETRAGIAFPLLARCTVARPSTSERATHMGLEADPAQRLRLATNDHSVNQPLVHSGA
jgi:hypothetical protein